MSIIQQLQVDAITLWEVSPFSTLSPKEKQKILATHKCMFASMRILGALSVSGAAYMGLHTFLQPRDFISEGVRIVGGVTLFVLGHDCYLISNNLEKAKITQAVLPVIEKVGRLEWDRKLLNKISSFFPNFLLKYTEGTILATTYNYYLSKKNLSNH